MTALEQVVAVLGRGVVPATSGVVTADDVGLTRGDGAFDATRVVTDASGASSIDHLDRHLDRFARSLQGLDAEFSDSDRAAWQALIDDAVSAWTTPGEAILKIMWSRGHESAASETTGVLTITPISAQALADRDGLGVALLPRGTSSSLYVDVPWLLGGVKSLSYAVNMAAKREAARRGAKDVVFTSSDGFCLEGPNAALLVFKDDQLATTPSGGTGILHSITQSIIYEQAAVEGLATATRLIRPQELFDAQGLWLASSVRGVAPITEVDGIPVASAPELTQRMREWVGFA